MYIIPISNYEHSKRPPHEHQTVVFETIWNFDFIRKLAPESTVYLSPEVKVCYLLIWQCNIEKKDKNSPHRGFTDDADILPEGFRKTVVQRAALLELMISQIANYAGVVSHNIIIKKNTLLQSVCKPSVPTTISNVLVQNSLILLDWNLTLYQSLIVFYRGQFSAIDGKLTHNDVAHPNDEELASTLENLVVLLWLRHIHEELLVQQRYYSKLVSHTH